MGVAWFRMHPNQRQPFGHVHDRAEEVYFVVSGSGRSSWTMTSSSSGKAT